MRHPGKPLRRSLSRSGARRAQGELPFAPRAAAAAPPASALPTPTLSPTPSLRRPPRPPLWLALELPALPLEAIAPIPSEPARAGHEACVVVSGRDARARVICASRAARAGGIGAGMRVSAALALRPDAVVRLRDEVAEAEALRWLGASAMRFTAFVSLRPPATVLLEIGASLRLFGGLERLTDAVDELIAALGYTTRCAVAPSAEAACLLARAGDARPARALGELTGRLAPVALAHLGLPERIEQALRDTGITTIGECLRLPRADLARRFGPALGERLDRALGRRAEALEPYRPAPRFERMVSFDCEVHESAPLLEAARRPLVELCAHLSARGEGLRRLAVHVVHRRGPASRVTLELVRASRDPQHLLDLLDERLDRLALDGAAHALGVAALEVAPLAPAAGDLLGAPGVPEEAWEVLLEWLRSHVGRQAVREIRPRADHRPERAWRWCEAGRGPAPPACVPLAPRPLWLLAQAEPLPIVGGRPWRDGPLELLDGPERIESGWWDGQDVSRDYFVARAPDGARLWIYRDLRAGGEWCLHGLFG